MATCLRLSLQRIDPCGRAVCAATCLHRGCSLGCRPGEPIWPRALTSSTAGSRQTERATRTRGHPPQGALHQGRGSRLLGELPMPLSLHHTCQHAPAGNKDDPRPVPVLGMLRHPRRQQHGKCVRTCSGSTQNEHLPIFQSSCAGRHGGGQTRPKPWLHLSGRIGDRPLEEGLLTEGVGGKVHLVAVHRRRPLVNHYP